MPTPVVSRDSMQEWFDVNPLREWRKRWKISRRVAAKLLNVSHGTVQNWECGLGQPQPEHFARLNYDGALVNWPARWKTWLEKKPDFPAQKSA